MFPHIANISDILPFLKGRTEFTILTRDGFQAVDYQYTVSDSFDCPIRRECRGIKFDLDGRLIARPLHKFFNLQEKPALIGDFASGCAAFEKLDGSMIHPAMVRKDLVFMTRAGISDQAKMAYDFAEKTSEDGDGIWDLCSNLVRVGKTPVFEFTSPANQIVVLYDKPAITLLAVRDNWSGVYQSREYLEWVASFFGVPLVRQYGSSVNDLKAFEAHTKALPDQEGYVIRAGQSFAKIKADDYVMRHRAKSNLLFEKDVLRLILENKIDDVLPMLSKDEAAKVTAWADPVKDVLSKLAGGFDTFAHYVSGRYSGRAAQAAVVISAADAGGMAQGAFGRSCVFAILDGKAPLGVVWDFARKQTTSTQKARDFLTRIGVEPWKPLVFEAAA